MSLLSEIKGWTPVIDTLTQEHGLITSAVFGVIWRYCQMEDRVCKASLEVIGERLNLNKSTVMRHIKTLCDNGYLEDLTPDRRNVPHVYKDTGKMQLRGTIEAVPVAQNNTKRAKKTVAEGNATVAQNNATVAESHLKKDTKRDSKKQKQGAQKPAPTPAKSSKPAAVEKYRDVARLWPDKSLWEMIDNTVGSDESDLTLWENVIRNYIACGWNKRNVKAMLEFFGRGEIPATNGKPPTKNGSPKNGHTPTMTNPLPRDDQFYRDIGADAQ